MSGCRQAGLSTTIQRCSLRNGSTQQTYIRWARQFNRSKVYNIFTARKALDDVGGNACEIMPKNKGRFRCGHRYSRIKKQTLICCITIAQEQDDKISL